MAARYGQVYLSLAPAHPHGHCRVNRSDPESHLEIPKRSEIMGEVHGGVQYSLPFTPARYRTPGVIHVLLLRS